MNDFESRARAAARAVHAAVDIPAGELTTAPRPHRGPTRALLIAAAVVIVAAVVGTTLVTRDEGAGPASDVTTFCAQVQQLVATPVDRINGEPQGREPSLEFLRDVPEEIRPAALEILTANDESRSPDQATSQEFLHWWQLRCYPQAAMPGAAVADRRFAPVPAPAAFEGCGASNGTPVGATVRPTDAFGTITVYGDATLADPYAGPMIGVVRTPEQVFYSDDHAAPLPVAGHPDAEIIDATGTWGAAIPELGQAVTWKDDRGVVTVIGRGWRRDQLTELAAIAARVTEGPQGPVLSDAGDLRVLYSGPVADIYARDVTTLASPTFTATYRIAGQTAGILSGTVADPSAVDATRFFAPELRRDDAAGGDVVAGDLTATNSEAGTAMRIATWNDDGVVLTLRWIDSSGRLPADTRFTDFARSTRRLDRSEWEELLSVWTCFWSESSSSGSATVESSDSSSDSTSTTSTP